MPRPHAAKVSSAYRAKLLRLLASLVGFALTYAVLLVGCTSAVVVSLLAAFEDPRLIVVAAIVLPCCLPLGAFLLSALLAPSSVVSGGRELALDEHPRLLAFIEALAGDAGVGRPAGLRLVPGVNAAMVRTRGGLFGGGRRELVVGLGLVNVLDQREFKAVLAHEFGHFAQSSTRAGQWAHALTMRLRAIVTGRTPLDLRLARARRSTRVPARALAAVLGLGVDGARGILRHRLAQIIRSNQAFARELEFNADLHAVRLVGSDPLVAALWRAQRGALAMNMALAGLRELAKHGVHSEDIYAHQQARLAELDKHLAGRADPMSQALARPYRYGPELHFPAGEAPAEIAWYAHPSYREREANAKEVYVAAEELELGSAWGLFERDAQLRLTMSVDLYLGAGARPTPAQMYAAAEVELRLGDELAERRQDPRYFGFYDNRLVDFGALDELLTQLTPAEGASENTSDAARWAAEGARWRGPRLEAFMLSWVATQQALDAARTPETRAELERVRAQQLEHARAGDRAVFAWMWTRARPDQREELLERCRFLTWVQAHIVTYNELHAQLQRGFAGVDVRGLARMSDVPEALQATIEQLRLALARTLGEANARSLPALSNLEQGARVRTVLGPVEVFEALAPEAELGPWLRSLTRTVAEVHGRLRTLHYKNLGALLSLQESIESDGLTRAEGTAR